MRKIISTLIILPLLVFSVIFLVANRQMVVIGLDPFSTDTPAIAIGPMPLWAALIGALLVGYMMGAGAAWRAGTAGRRKARNRHKELKALKREVTLLAPAPDGSETGKTGLKRVIRSLSFQSRRSYDPEARL